MPRGFSCIFARHEIMPRRIQFLCHAVVQRRAEASRRRARRNRRLLRELQRNARMKAITLMICSCLLLATIKYRAPRTIWVFPRWVLNRNRIISTSCNVIIKYNNNFGCRSTHFWDHVVLQCFSPADWLENFRMRRETFNYLCDQLRPIISRRDTLLRKAISTERRVAICLWCLATPTEYRTIAHLFGVARSTVCSIVQETSAAIVQVLMRRYIEFPKGQKLKDVIDGFERKWGFPQCAGAIDGSHIPVCAPELNHTDYYNRKGFYSMIVQAVVDQDYLFRDICVGWPGSVHDARVLVNSSIYARILRGEVLQGYRRTILRHEIQPLLVGDSAYPIEKWLMKPFADNTMLTDQQKKFNYRLSRARIVAECAFGRLKARWRRVLKRNDMNLQHVPTVITACCILHNLCEIHGESFNDAWLSANTTSIVPSAPACQQSGRSDVPNVIRNTLMRYLNSH